MADDKKVTSLTAVTQLSGTEVIYVAQGSTDKSALPSHMREYISVPWKGRNPTGSVGIPSCVLGNIQATNVTIVGSAFAFHFIPFILTAEQAVTGLTKLNLKFQGNSGATANRIYITVYNALTDALLGEVARTITPNSNAWVSLQLPTIATWPRQVYVGISSGINGGAGADVSMAEASILSCPGYVAEANIIGSTGVSAACGFIVSSNWNVAPDLSGLACDGTSISKMPFCTISVL